MGPCKQSFQTVSVRLTEKELVLFECKAEELGMTKSEYFRHCLSLPQAQKRKQATTIDRKLSAKLLALLGKSRLFVNINQLVYAIHCGSFSSREDVIEIIFELAEDIKFIRNALLKHLGKNRNNQ